jgi:hypothetical protein
MSIETISCIPKLPDPVSCSTEFARHLHDALVNPLLSLYAEENVP